MKKIISLVILIISSIMLVGCKSTVKVKFVFYDLEPKYITLEKGSIIKQENVSSFLKFQNNNYIGILQFKRNIILKT